MSRLLTTLLAVATMTVACYQDDTTGNTNTSPLTNVLLTDAPFPFDTVQGVNVYVISVSVSNGKGASVSSTLVRGLVFVFPVVSS